MSKTDLFPQEHTRLIPYEEKSSHQVLAEFLIEVFDAGELRRFITNGDDTRILDSHLPAVGSPLIELADSFISGADRRGLLTTHFFERLAAERPHRARTIASIAETFPALTELSQSTNFHPLRARPREWFSFRLKLGRLMIAIALSMVGFYSWVLLFPPPDRQFDFLLHVTEKAKRALSQTTLEQTTKAPVIPYVDNTTGDAVDVNPLMGPPPPLGSLRISTKTYATAGRAADYCSTVRRNGKARLANKVEMFELKIKLKDGYYWINPRPPLVVADISLDPQIHGVDSIHPNLLHIKGGRWAPALEYSAGRAICILDWP